MLCLGSEEIDYVYLFFFTKKEVDIMYHGIQKKIVTDEWLIKETKVKQELKDKGYKNIYYNKVDEEKKNARRSKAASQ